MKYDAGRKRLDLFKKKQQERKPRGPLLPISVFVIVLLLAAFSLIRPLQSLTNINPANVTVPPFTPTPTALPAPTDVHGGHIVFTCTRKDVNQICMIRADGSGYAQLTNQTHNSFYPVISPDAQRVVFALNEGDLFNLNTLTLANEDVNRLTYYIGNSFSPDFSPDGRQLVFVNRVGDSHSALWLVGSRGEQPHMLYQGSKDIVGASWSRDGNWIAFTMEVDSPFTYEVFVLDAHHPDVAPRRISHDLSGIGGGVDWAPDGSNVVIFAGPVAAREIYRLDVPSGDFTQLTHGGNNAAASYSPDGQYIVFNSLRNSGQADLYTMRSDGHSQHQLTSDPEPDWQPQWGP